MLLAGLFLKDLLNILNIINDGTGIDNHLSDIRIEGRGRNDIGMYIDPDSGSIYLGTNPDPDSDPESRSKTRSRSRSRSIS